MEKKLTKLEIKQAINRAVYERVNQHYPDFDIDHGEGSGRVCITAINAKTSKNMIEYHQSRHTFDTYEPDEATLEIVKDLERVVSEEQAKYN